MTALIFQRIFAGRRALLLCIAALAFLSLGCSPPSKADIHAPPPSHYLVDLGGAKVVMNGEEKKLHDALESQVSWDLQNEPLQEVLDRISQEHRIEMELTDYELENAGINKQAPVTVTCKQVTLRKALHHLLEPLHLYFSTQEGKLRIWGTWGDEHFQRFYYVKDFLVTEAHAPAPYQRLGWAWSASSHESVGSTKHPQTELDELVNLIKALVDLDSWDDNGGSYSIEKLPRRNALLIDQSEAGHAQVVDLFRKLHALPRD